MITYYKCDKIFIIKRGYNVIYIRKNNRFFKSLIPKSNERVPKSTHIAAAATVAAVAYVSRPAVAAVLGIGYIGAAWKWNSSITSTSSTAAPKVDAVAAPVISNRASEATGFEKYKALLLENQIDEERALVLPTRRVCGFGGMESLHTQALAKKAVFITEAEILKIHPMRFLRRSPFVMKIDPMSERYFEELDDNDPIWKSIFDSTSIRLHAIGLTESGKHVILQQAVKSCVPSCVAMLVLDHGKMPDYKTIKFTNLANQEEAIAWVRAAGLNPQMTIIKDLENAANILNESIQKYGSGVLSINHPKISGHVEPIQVKSFGRF